MRGRRFLRRDGGGFGREEFREYRGGLGFAGVGRKKRRGR